MPPSVPAGSMSSVGNTIGYAGYVWDPALGGAASGQFLARHRWYSPNLGRWTSRDPIGYADGMNLYGYVGGMPLMLVDPMGLYGIGQWWHDTKEGAIGARDWLFTGKVYAQQHEIDAALGAAGSYMSCLAKCLAGKGLDLADDVLLGLLDIESPVDVSGGGIGVNPVFAVPAAGKTMEFIGEGFADDVRGGRRGVKLNTGVLKHPGAAESYKGLKRFAQVGRGVSKVSGPVGVLWTCGEAVAGVVSCANQCGGR